MRIICQNCNSDLVVESGEITKLFVRRGDVVIHVKCLKCNKYVGAEYSLDINGIFFIGAMGNERK